MKPEHITAALDIIRASAASITVSLNTPVNGNYSHVYDILIIRSNATVIKDLVEAGFSLCMTDKGLAVDKF